jgi:Translin family
MSNESGLILWLVPALLDSVRPVLLGCRDTTSALAAIIPKNQFWRWKDLWSNSIRTAIFAALLIEYLTTRGLLTIAQVAETLGSASILNFIEIPLFTLFFF